MVMLAIRAARMLDGLHLRTRPLVLVATDRITGIDVKGAVRPAPPPPCCAGPRPPGGITMTEDALAGGRRAEELLAALAEPAGRADPYPLYERLRALGPAVTAPDGALVVTGYQDCSALLRDHRLRKEPERALAALGYPDWRDRPSLRLMFTSILTLDAPAHTRLRRLVSAAFTVRRVQGLRPAVEQIVAQACEQVAGENDFVAHFAFPLPVTVIGELLGIPAADRPMFRDLVRDWAAVLEILTPLAVDRADVAASAIGGYLADLAAHRRVHPADDLVSGAGRRRGR
jgi:cytochrome P450